MGEGEICIIPIKYDSQHCQWLSIVEMQVYKCWPGSLCMYMYWYLG